MVEEGTMTRSSANTASTIGNYNHQTRIPLLDSMKVCSVYAACDVFVFVFVFVFSSLNL